MCCSLGDLFLGVLAIIFPPFSVWVRRGLCSADSLINILLCLLGYIPGLIHAWYIIAVTPSYYDNAYYQDLERQGHTQHHVAYMFVDGRDGQGQQQRIHKPGATPSYGTTRSSGQASGPSSAPAPAPAAAPPSGSSSQQPAKPPAPANQAAPADDAGEGSASGPPPTYADAVKGDHKIQHDD